MYDQFARVYDRFMSDVPYQQWADYIQALFGLYGENPSLIVDLGCGTGTLTDILASRGYDVIAIDSSPSMLMQAQNKFSLHQHSVLCLNQDMRDFELYGTADAFLCSCDGINYLSGANDLLRVFRLVENYLEPGGLFVFDMNTQRRFQDIYADHTFADAEEDVAYIWQNEYLPDKKQNLYQVTFFEKQENGQYERFEETHIEHVFEPEAVCALLRAAGLKVCAVLDAFTMNPAGPLSERICFVAQEHLYQTIGHKRSLDDLPPIEEAEE